MIVLNAGVPRSGTVLVNAILRELFRLRGVPHAQANPHGAELPKLVGRLIATGEARHKTVLVHTHSWDAETARLLAGSPHFTGFANYRDPRDVCVSLMRLHDHDFETAAEMTLGAFRLFEATCRDVDVMAIPYELLVTGTEATIFQIARRLGFWPTLAEVHAVAEATGQDRAREVMEKVQKREIEGLAVRQNRNRVLAEDPATLINDRHIQSGRSGRWRDELDAEAQARAADLFAPILVRHGYS